MLDKRWILRQGFAASLLPVTVLALTHPAVAQHYVQQNLVSDLAQPPGGAPKILDPDLLNPWGVAYSSTGPFWVANQGNGKATIYAVDGTTGAISKSSLVVTIPASLVGQPGGPAAVISIDPQNFDFAIRVGILYGGPQFLFSALNGTISGWNPDLPPPAPSTVAQLAVTGYFPPVSYTGLAMALRGAHYYLFAANSGRGSVDVFYPGFFQYRVGPFFDRNLPSGDVPFNIANIGGKFFVTYKGPVGVVNVFDTDGDFLQRFATGDTLFNPWGIALAPANFGKFSNCLLIGNFNHSLTGPNGPGWISAFDPITGKFRGLLEDHGKPIEIDGLRSLTFGNGVNGGIPNVLYFSAGIGSAPGVNLETHGLLGSLTWEPPNLF